VLVNGDFNLPANPKTFLDFVAVIVHLPGLTPDLAAAAQKPMPSYRPTPKMS